MRGAARLSVMNSRSDLSGMNDLSPEELEFQKRKRSFQPDLSVIDELMSNVYPNRAGTEEDFVNPMRILGLSLPPDVSDELRDAQFKFEKAMFALTKATKGYRKDLPVAVSDAEIQAAENAWEDGRVAINEFFTIMNKTVEADELKTIPANKKEYGRSESKYFNLMKKTKLCQNRGGPTLSQTWGGLMITGYMQDSCGIPDLQEYFYQQS